MPDSFAAGPCRIAAALWTAEGTRVPLEGDGSSLPDAVASLAAAARRAGEALGGVASARDIEIEAVDAGGGRLTASGVDADLGAPGTLTDPDAMRGAVAALTAFRAAERRIVGLLADVLP